MNHVGNNEELSTASSSYIPVKSIELGFHVRNCIFLIQKKIITIISSNLLGAGQVAVMEALGKKLWHVLSQENHLLLKAIIWKFEVIFPPS